MAVTEARIAGIERQVCEHDEFINGNGKPGAKVQFKSLEDGLKNLNERFDKLEKKLDTINGAITGLALSVVGAVVVYVLLNVIPHVAK